MQLNNYGDVDNLLGILFEKFPELNIYDVRQDYEGGSLVIVYWDFLWEPEQEQIKTYLAEEFDVTSNRLVFECEKLSASDRERRQLESKIKQAIADAISHQEIPQDVIGSVRLRWTFLTKIMRFFNINARGKVLKIRLHNDDWEEQDEWVGQDTWTLESLLWQFRNEYDISSVVATMNFAERTKQEREIVQRTSH